MCNGKEIRYICVNKLLHGDLKPKHWDKKARLFKPNAPFAAENNKTLVDMKMRYDKALLDYNGSLFSFSLNVKNDVKIGHAIDNEDMTLKRTLEWCVENAKESRHADGTMCGTFETYLKVIRWFERYFASKKVKYESMKMTDVDECFVNDFLNWVDKGTGRAQYVSCMLKSALNKADKQGWFDFRKVEKCKWRKRVRSSKKKYETLTEEQCKEFAQMPLKEFPPSPRKRLFRDFCLFILYTGQSACDAITLKYSDIRRINGVDHFVFKRRKIESKQSVDCTVPINPTMRKIMQFWKAHAKNGYVFPIRSNETLKLSAVANTDIKVFVKCCNVWLKGVGKTLGCDFDLHTYVFRHTAITRYISKGVPVVYVANLVGTSVENCQNIYYNNHGDTASRDKVLAAMSL